MSVRTQAYAALRICYFNGIIPLWRSPLLIAAVFLTPFSFLFFLFVIASPALLPFGVTGGVLFSALFTGNGMMNDCAYLRLERQLQAIFVASPVTSLAYLLGMALSELAFTVPALTLFLVILGLVHPLSGWAVGLLVGVVLLTWLMATTLGFLLSTMFRQLREIWPIATLIFSALSILPPVFYPLSIIPGRYEWVAFLAPSTSASQLADHAVGLSYGSAVSPAFLGATGFEFLVLAGATVLFGALALWLARWREP
ncbi:MAG TPA: ABC transporter permease [Thermoplasmata archaeon]|nr:ABC transporter permease [Thermoplasmata archaeon]